MSSDEPKRSITPYAPFEAPHTPTETAPAPSPSSHPPTEFTQAIRDELDRIEQSITENVRRALQRLGTLVIEKQDETIREVARANSRLNAHAQELRTLREAIEHAGTILPPPPDSL